jgi:2-dehydro-3-deoxygluconokinase
VVKQLMEKAKTAGVKISFDVNFRVRLWTPKQAKTTLDELMERPGILMLTREDAQGVLRLSGTPEAMVGACWKEYRCELCILTLGADGGIGFDGKNYYYCNGRSIGWGRARRRKSRLFVAYRKGR